MESLCVAFPVASEPEAAADENRAVPPRGLEFVHRVYEQGGGKAFALRFLATERDHVGGDITAVDVEAGPKVRDEQAPRAARDIKRGLTALDVLLEVPDLAAVFVELGPPPRTEPVMPGLWRAKHERRTEHTSGPADRPEQARVRKSSRIA